MARGLLKRIFTTGGLEVSTTLKNNERRHSEEGVTAFNQDLSSSHAVAPLILSHTQVAIAAERQQESDV